MSKRKRGQAQARTRLSRPRPSRNSVVSQEGQDLTQVLPRLLDDTAADIRLLFSGHEALGDLAINRAPGTSSSGSGVAAAETTPFPVALIEPAITGHVPPAIPGRPPYDLRTAIAAKLGLPVLGAQASPLDLARSWTLEHHAGTFVLTDPTGSVLARSNAPGQPRWSQLAQQLGQVVVIYGPEVGVRPPGGIPPDHYDDNARAAELSRSQASGTANWGIVRFVDI